MIRRAAGALGGALSEFAAGGAEAKRSETAQRFFGVLGKLSEVLTTLAGTNTQLTSRIVLLCERLENPTVLCGIHFYPKYAKAKEGEPAPVGGRAAKLRMGEVARFGIQPDTTVESFRLEAWGGCVITEVKFGNHAKLATWSGEEGVLAGEFGKVEVGSMIYVHIRLPVPESRPS